MHKKRNIRKLSGILAIIVIILQLFNRYIPASIYAAEDELPVMPSFIYGYLNNDGIVNTKDAVLIKQYLAGYKELEINLAAADVSKDNAITSADAVKLLRYLAGYDVTLGTE